MQSRLVASAPPAGRRLMPEVGHQATARQARRHPHKMLLSAAEVLRERGAAGVTIDEVLTRSGAPRGSVYYHFPDGRNQTPHRGPTVRGRLDHRSSSTTRWKRRALALVEFVEFWERTLAESGFTAGCPVVAAAIGSSDDDPKLTTVAASSSTGGAPR